MVQLCLRQQKNTGETARQNGRGARFRGPGQVRVTFVVCQLWKTGVAQTSGRGRLSGYRISLLPCQSRHVITASCFHQRLYTRAVRAPAVVYSRVHHRQHRHIISSTIIGVLLILSKSILYRLGIPSTISLWFSLSSHSRSLAPPPHPRPTPPFLQNLGLTMSSSGETPLLSPPMPSPASLANPSAMASDAWHMVCQLVR